MKLALSLALTVALLCSCTTAESRLARGDALYARGDYALALEEYHAARAQDPMLLGVEEKIRETHIRFHLMQGDAALARRSWQDAEQCYREAGRFDPGNQEIAARLLEVRTQRANQHFLRGQELLARANPFDAVLEFEHALTFQSDHPRAADALERALNDKNERENKSSLAFDQGRAHRQSGDLEAAVESFRTALELNPHHPEAPRHLTEGKTELAAEFMRQGDAWLGEQQWDRARDAFLAARANNVRQPGIDERLRRVERRREAARLLAEADQAFASEDWKLAYERYASAQRLTEDKSFRARYETARERHAATIYGRAEDAETSGDLREAALLYRSIGDIDVHYRDSVERADRIDGILRTADEAYAAGRTAEERGDLTEAQAQFRVCSGALAGYRDVDERFAAVSDALDSAGRFYDRAAQAEERGDYARAQVLFDECLQIASPFRDLPGRLVSLRQRIAERDFIEENYAEACRAQEARDLEQARELFVACSRRDPEFRGVRRRLSAVDAALETAESLYRRAARAERRCDLKRAGTLYDECLHVSQPYRDAAERLLSIREALVLLREAHEWKRERRLPGARSRCRRVLESYEAHVEARDLLHEIDHALARVDERYQALLAAETVGKFEVALTHAEAIQRECVGFEDVERRVVRLSTERDYVAGCRLERSGKLEEAARHFERCLERDANFRDAGDRLRACHAKVSGTP